MSSILDVNLVPSKLEELFLRAWGKHGLGRIPQQQYRFSPTRKFRADFAWPDKKLIVEVDGFGGGHQMNWRLAADHERQNHAVELGWRVLRYTSRQLGSKDKRKIAIEQVVRILNDES